MNTPNIGIALSGGGARGAAHIGALQALNENNIFPTMVSGSSAGALIGAIYCSGYTPLEMLALCKEHAFLKIFKIGFTNKGLTELKYLEAFLKTHLKAKTFEDLKIPLSIGVTNINTGMFEVRSSGDLIKTILASCSIPLLFKPVKLDKDVYIDGGVLNNLPIEPLQETCDKIIGISVCPHVYKEKVVGIKDIAERVFHLGVWNTMEHRLKQCDVAIEIEGAFQFGIFDLKHASALFDAGYQTTIAKMNMITENISSDKK